jgi:hypothetical protein
MQSESTAPRQPIKDVVANRTAAWTVPAKTDRASDDFNAATGDSKLREHPIANETSIGRKRRNHKGPDLDECRAIQQRGRREIRRTVMETSVENAAEA